MEDDYIREMEELYAQTLKQGQKQKFSRVVCPHTYDTHETKNTCKLCDLCRETIWDRSKSRDDPIKGVARRYSAKKKYYSNILFMAKPDEIVILEYGDKIFNKLIAAQMDKLSEWKNFMHPTQGRNLYITKIKIGPETKDVDYNVEPRLAISPLPNIQILNQLPNLDNIIADIEAGNIKPVPQSKFEFAKTEVRILPSGDKTKPLKFFKLAFWHENITKEEFDAVQAGKYNPITGLYTTAPSTPSVTVTTAKVMSTNDVLAEWGLTPEDATAINDALSKQETATQSMPAEPEDSGVEAEGNEEDFNTSVEPICFGRYDKNNTICNNKCHTDGWGDACKKLYEQQLAIRSQARRLTK
jgi:hypothetical protein